jgi:DNA polymerase-1
MRYLLIDFDSVVHNAVRCSKDIDEEGFVRDKGLVMDSMNGALESIMEGVSEQSQAPIHRVGLFISGRYSFRKLVHSDYKANRKNTPKPVLLNWAMREAENTFGALRVDGLEADDVVLATKKKLEEDWENEVVVATIDKDLRQVEGLFYDYYYTRNELVKVSKEEAVVNFWKQMLTGDRTDNIQGIKGIGEKKAEKIIGEHSSEYGMFRAVYAQYITHYGSKSRLMYEKSFRLLRMVTEGIPTMQEFKEV